MSTGHTEPPRLVADVGGTHARFALAGADGGLSSVQTLAGADFPSLQAAIEHYLNSVGGPPVAHAAVAIATPVQGDQVHMTNRDWGFSIADMRRRMGWQTLLVLNDFTALALSLPLLAPSDLRQLGGDAPLPGQAIGLLGPGTGLGVSGLVPTPQGAPVPLAGEGGHVSFAPMDDAETALLQFARARHGHVSAERILSGSGLELIHAWLCARDGTADAALPATEISARGCRGEDARCIEAVDLFCAALGTVAGNLALTLGARGGIFVGGGIVPKLGDCFMRSRFRARFEDKGRFAAYLRAIPVFVIHSPHPALTGAAQALTRHLLSPSE